MTKRQVKVVSTLCLLGPVATGSKMIKNTRVWVKVVPFAFFEAGYSWIYMIKIIVKVSVFLKMCLNVPALGF